MANNSSFDPSARVPGQDDILDILSRLTVGGTEEENAARGQVRYPGIPIGQAQHAQQAEVATNRFGPIATQVGGMAVEGFEHAFGANRSPAGRQDTVRDFVANAMGSASTFVGKDKQEDFRVATGRILEALRARQEEKGQAIPFELADVLRALGLGQQNRASGVALPPNTP